MTRFIFITGGVVSSLGKGITASSIAVLLQANGFKVRLRKFDPYLNVDPGTMSPYQHGEVYVTEDGTETDLDLGHYERFTGVITRSSDSYTSGKIYSDVLRRERQGEYLGGTVQVIPHITDAIKEAIKKDITDEDFVLCEIGGTVGDIESLPFIEAIRQFANEIGRHNALFVHLTLLPYIASAGEIKTKPSQHSVRELLSLGIQPDVLICRCDREISLEIRHKLALFCNVLSNRVIEGMDAKSIYSVPQQYHQQHVDREILNYFNMIPKCQPDLSQWQKITDCLLSAPHQVRIAIVGKYVEIPDADLSLRAALEHGGISHNVRIHCEFISAENMNVHMLEHCDGIVIPGGFGERGIEGKIATIRYAREKNIPFLGICLGMQLAVIETARHVAGLTHASSSEFGSTPHPIIGLMTEWSQGKIAHQRSEEGDMGGTMRLGLYPCLLQPHSRAFDIYHHQSLIQERHRHRYEMNTDYIPDLEKAGLYVSGLSPDGRLPEIIERRDHPWFIAVQYHPELCSKPYDPHPLFTSFIEAALNHQKTRQELS